MPGTRRNFDCVSSQALVRRNCRPRLAVICGDAKPGSSKLASACWAWSKSCNCKQHRLASSIQYKLAQSPVVNPAVASAPKTAHRQAANHSIYVTHDDANLHYLFYYRGDFATTNRNSHNAHSLAWLDYGSIALPKGRTFSYHRESTDPQFLQVNGKQFDLGQGRVFVLNDDGIAKQLNFAPQLNWANDPTMVGQMALGAQAETPSPAADIPPPSIVREQPPRASTESAARLQFRLEGKADEPDVEKVAYQGRAAYSQQVLIDETAVESAHLNTESTGLHTITVKFAPEYVARIRQATEQNRGRRLAVLFDGHVLIAPVLQSTIGDSAQITGNLSETETKVILEVLNKTKQKPTPAPSPAGRNGPPKGTGVPKETDHPKDVAPTKDTVNRWGEPRELMSGLLDATSETIAENTFIDLDTNRTASLPKTILDMANGDGTEESKNGRLVWQWMVREKLDLQAQLTPDRPGVITLFGSDAS